jgi:hypothetical protein
MRSSHTKQKSMSLDHSYVGIFSKIFLKTNNQGLDSIDKNPGT